MKKGSSDKLVVSGSSFVNAMRSGSLSEHSDVRRTSSTIHAEQKKFKAPSRPRASSRAETSPYVHASSEEAIGEPPPPSASNGARRKEKQAERAHAPSSLPRSPRADPSDTETRVADLEESLRKIVREASTGASGFERAQIINLSLQMLHVVGVKTRGDPDVEIVMANLPQETAGVVEEFRRAATACPPVAPARHEPGTERGALAEVAMRLSVGGTGRINTDQLQQWLERYLADFREEMLDEMRLTDMSWLQREVEKMGTFINEAITTSVAIRMDTMTRTCQSVEQMHKDVKDALMCFRKEQESLARREAEFRDHMAGHSAQLSGAIARTLNNTATIERLSAQMRNTVRLDGDFIPISEAPSPAPSPRPSARRLDSVRNEGRPRGGSMRMPRRKKLDKESAGEVSIDDLRKGKMGMHLDMAKLRAAQRRDEEGERAATARPSSESPKDHERPLSARVSPTNLPPRVISENPSPIRRRRAVSIKPTLQSESSGSENDTETSGSSEGKKKKNKATFAIAVPLSTDDIQVEE